MWKLKLKYACGVLVGAPSGSSVQVLLGLVFGFHHKLSDDVILW